MIKTIFSPVKSSWNELARRPVENNEYLTSTVKNILVRVKMGGDKALISFSEQFDKIRLTEVSLPFSEAKAAADQIPEELKRAIDQAYENIKHFHEAQRPENIDVETMPGVSCTLKYLPLQTVGLYIPGGTAPLFSSVLMLAIPAQIAGCKNIYLCSPPDKHGSIHNAICYAALKCGIRKIFRVGGAQAIGAMAYGTESIPRADKIFGPGNQFVTMAKQLVNLEGIAIDMPAGPSEVAVFADSTSNPEFIAADLLSQAEHGKDSQVLLVTTDKEILKKTDLALREQLENLTRKELAVQAVANSKALYFEAIEEAFEFINTYAPEHFIIASENADELIENVINAGSVFLGNLTPEAAGDYASGTNHTLPTNGTARSFSGITLMSFMKTITFQRLTSQGVHNLAPVVETMAKYEHLEAHRMAMQLRRESL